MVFWYRSAMGHKCFSGYKIASIHMPKQLFNSLLNELIRIGDEPHEIGGEFKIHPGNKIQENSCGRIVRAVYQLLELANMIGRDIQENPFVGFYEQAFFLLPVRLA